MLISWTLTYFTQLNVKFTYFLHLRPSQKTHIYAKITLHLLKRGSVKNSDLWKILKTYILFLPPHY